MSGTSSTSKGGGLDEISPFLHVKQCLTASDKPHKGGPSCKNECPMILGCGLEPYGPVPQNI